jgi:ATP-binding cassette, subfamily B, multidrug efflux pump
MAETPTLVSNTANNPPDAADQPHSFSGDSSKLSNRQLLGWMMRFAWPVKWWALAAMTALIVVAYLEMKSIQFLGESVNIINEVHAKTVDPTQAGFWSWFTGGDPDAVKIRTTLKLFAFVVIGVAVARFVRETLNILFSMHMVFYLREAVYDKLQRVGFTFHDNISSGNLINRALSDLQNVRGFVQTALFTTLDILFGVAFSLYALSRLSGWVALLSLVPIPFWIYYILRYSKKIQPAIKSTLESEDRNVSIITENIAGVHVVKSFATEKSEIQKYVDNGAEYKKRVLDRIRLSTNFQPIIRGIAMASNVSLFMLAGSLIIFRKMRPGDLVQLGGLMWSILAKLQGIAGINEQYQNAIVSARRLYEVLMAPSNVPEKDGALPLPRGGLGEVVFDNVSFAYGTGKNVLHNISFRAPGGKVIAIVGPTGAGKSTLVNLISRFYDPAEGTITVDGVDLRDAKLASVRTQVSFVFQETYLFSQSVKDNIAYGRPGISDGDIEAAARLAQAHEFIESLPKKYDTLLGERGTNLSGGQRQRLAIARAILTNPRVLVLDDATAAIDAETEDLIRRGMKFVMAGRTTFIIAHRISTVKQADLVLVLEEGRITQSGTHDQLMAEDGHYREIAMVQLMRGDQVRPPDEESPSHNKRMRDPGTVLAAKMQAAPTEEEVD